MKRFLMTLRRDGSYHEQAEKFFCDSAEIMFYDTPDPNTTKHSERDREFYGAQRTVALRVSWEDGEPKVTVNGKRINCPDRYKEATHA